MSADVVNFNVGILGHVDSGKTSLAKALSSVSSTAAFDKNPQSQERGITLDLGFSSFTLENNDGGNKVQYTLVDCPGHASLIRTIIGGAQIIDLMILVVDVTKGIQTQTAECIIIGEITCPNMIVALNKIDLLDEDKRNAVVEKVTKKLKITLSKTVFKDAPIVAISAASTNSEEGGSMGLEGLLNQLKEMTKIPKRDSKGNFLFSVDHCFSIRGQGTIMTGTVLQGSVSINENVEIVCIRESRKVKSIQMFKKPVQTAMQGDRIGLCVTNFDSKLLERGLVSTPGSVPTLYGGVIQLQKIPYFKGEIATKSKFHISLGHETVLGKLTLFSRPPQRPGAEAVDEEGFRIDDEYQFQELLSDAGKDAVKEMQKPVFAIIEFERPVPVIPNCKVLGSKLDSDTHTTACRMAFHGTLSYSFSDKNYVTTDLPLFKIFKEKKKEGVAERANNECEVICKGMFKKETNLALFTGLQVTLSTGEKGKIGEPFGQSGKFKVWIPDGLQESTLSMLGGKKKKAVTEGGGETVKLNLLFKRYVFSKKMVQ